MNIEHTNFIRNSRKYLHCGECGRPFDTDSLRPHVLACGHNVCEQCMSSQRLSAGVQCCLICDKLHSQTDRTAPVSHDLLGIVYGKEQALKRVPLKYRCRECTTLYKENDMTVCRTCSGWSEGIPTEEATDFAKRPISSLICWICAGHHRHANHDKMSLDIINRIWDTPIATEYIETQLGTAEKLLDLLRGGAVNQINYLAECFSEKLEVFKLKISNGQFPLDSTVHIAKAVDVISAQIRHWNIGIQKSSEDAHLLLEYFETLVKHVVETPQKSGGGKWERPARRTGESDEDEDLRIAIKRNIRELKAAMPISDELKLSQSPEPGEHVEQPSETTTNASADETPSQKRLLYNPFFAATDYQDRPRRINTKKNYALEDEAEQEAPPRKRARRKVPGIGEPTTSHAANSVISVSSTADLSPYNLNGTHLSNDPVLVPPPPVPRPRAPRGRGRRRGFRGGRGSRGGYRHLAVPLNSSVLVENEIEPHQPTSHDQSDHLFDTDLQGDAMHEPIRSSFETVESDNDRLQSHETPPVSEPTTEQLFQELIGSSTNGTVSSSSGGGGQPAEAQGPSPSPLSQSSSPPFVEQPPKTIMPVDFLGQTNGSRNLRSPYADGYAKKQRPWEEVSQEARYGSGSVADHYQRAPPVPAQSFINNTPPY